MKCAECRACFKPKQLKQAFCQPSCTLAWHNRAAKRGKLLTPLLIASREGRSDPVAKWALSEYCRLAGMYRDEDKAAGRMSALNFLKRQQSLYLRS